MKHKVRELLMKLIFTFEKYFFPLTVLQNYIVAYNRTIVYEYNVKELALDIAKDMQAVEYGSPRSLGVEIGLAGPNKMEALVETRVRDRNFGEDRVRKSKYMTAVSERLRAGHWCFVAERSGEILAYKWVAFGELYESTMRRRIFLRQGEALLYDSYTAYPHRGKGLSPRINRQIFTALRKINYEKAYGLVEDYNKPSRRVVEKSGGRAKGTIIYLKILTMSRLLKTPNSSILDLTDDKIAFTGEIADLKRSTGHAKGADWKG